MAAEVLEVRDAKYATLTCIGRIMVLAPEMVADAIRQDVSDFGIRKQSQQIIASMRDYLESQGDRFPDPKKHEVAVVIAFPRTEGGILVVLAVDGNNTHAFSWQDGKLTFLYVPEDEPPFNN